MKKLLGLLLCCMGIVAFGSDVGNVASKKIAKLRKKANRRKRKLDLSRGAEEEMQRKNADLQSQLAKVLAQNELLEEREVQSGKRNRALERRLGEEGNKAATYHAIMVGLRQRNDALLVQLRSLGFEGESPLDKLVRSFQEKDEQTK
jgi:hypothetical protein